MDQATQKRVDAAFHAWITGLHLDYSPDNKSNTRTGFEAGYLASEAEVKRLMQANVILTDELARLGLQSQASQANGRLIAAAPDLLALVRKHLEDHLEACHITRRGEDCSLVIETRALIAKAEGRS